MKNSYTQSSFKEVDDIYENKLRPALIHDFVGQDSLKKKLRIVIEACKQRKDVLTHCLFYGPPGLGKTTLASIVANEMNAKIVHLSGPAIEKAGDLAGILTSLSEGDILFIDEIHRMSRQIEEYLYPAMEDFVLDLTIDSGSNARSIQVKINKFTLIGATTKLGQISSPLRSRFGFHSRLEFYPSEILQTIITRSSKILGHEIEPEAAYEIGKRSRGTPRIANNLLKWVRDFCMIQKKLKIALGETLDALKMLNIDEKGLDEMDVKLLSTIIDHHEGGPVGLKTLAGALGEDEISLTEVYEPFLITEGLLKITPRGREVTKLAFKHLNRPFPLDES